MRKVLIAVLVASIVLLSSLSTATALGRPKLEIIAPETVSVGEEVTITVVAEGKPIEGVTVYANLEKIGETDANGELTYTFNEPGAKVLVARKEGYRTSVELTLSVLPRLEVSAPNTANVGEKITITVTSEGKPVAGAKVYVKSDIFGRTLIGETDSSGELRYIFEEPGTYMIGVEKEGYASIPVESGEVVVVKPKGALKLTVTEVEVVEEQGKVKQVTNIYVTANGHPVERAEIYTNNELVGYTDSNGLLVYKFEPGVYIIVAKKKGYLPAAEFILNVNEGELREKLRGKIEERVNISEELTGVVIKPSSYIKKIIKEEILSRVSEDKREIAEELAKVKITSLKQYILLSKDKMGILLTKENIPECFANVKGFGLGFVDYRGYKWYIFYAVGFKVLDEKGTPATVDEVLSNVENYKFKLLNLSTHYRAISITLMYEEAKIAIPVTIGFVSDHAKIRGGFIADMLKHAGKFNRSERLARESIDNILQFDNPMRIAVFRLKPSYWVDSDAYVKGVLLCVDDVKAYMSIMPDRLKEISLPKNAKFVLLEIDKTIKGEETSIEDIRDNPEKFEGKQVVVTSVGAGVNISTNQVIERVLKAASMTLPALAPAAAAAEANPVDVLVQAEARWYPSVPSSRYQIIPAVGALGYDGEYKIKEAVESKIESNKVSKVYGYVVAGSKFGFDFPVIVIQDKKLVGTISRGEIREELMNAIEEIKEKIREKVEEDIKASSGIAFGKKITPEIELVKKLNIENERVVKVGDKVVIKVTFKESPVSNAAVEITKRGLVVAEGKTDANGQFVTSFDERGVYVIKASKEGYRPDVSVVAVVPAAETHIHFVHILPVIKPEEPGVIKVNKTAVKEIKLRVKRTVENVVTDIRELRDLPKEVKKPSGHVYMYLEINVSVRSEDVEQGEITFNVTKEWLMNNSIDKNKVTLKRYFDGKWTALETKLIGEDERDVYYTAKTPGFSYYVITGEKEVVTATPTKPTPGFEAVLAVAGLVASFYLIRKER